MSENLLKRPPFRHRDLFVGGIGNRTPKASYTVQDLWNYCNLVFLGKNLPSPAISSKEMREARRQQILSEVPPIPGTYERVLKEFVDRYGLEVVLMAAEEYYSQDSEAFPSPEGMGHYLRDAAAEFNRLIRRGRVEN